MNAGKEIHVARGVNAVRRESILQSDLLMLQSELLIKQGYLFRNGKLH